MMRERVLCMYMLKSATVVFYRLNNIIKETIVLFHCCSEECVVIINFNNRRLIMKYMMVFPDVDSKGELYC